MPKPIKHILVIRFSALGDVAMTVPVIRAFVQQYPGVRLTILTKSFLKPLFEDIDNLKVISADLKGEHRGLKGLYKLSRELKKHDIDAVADWHNVLRTKVLRALLPKPFVQIDKGRKEKKAIVKGIIFEQLKATHQRYADVFETLGFKIDLSNPEFPDKAKLDEDLSTYFDVKTKVVGIAPFAAHKGKMYPLQAMKVVISELAKNYRVLLFGGGKSEVETLEEIAATNKNVYNFAGKLNLRQELHIISNLDLMLSMDSGNGHLAAMYGINVVSIWGVTHPYFGFYPFNQDLESALLADRRKYPKIPTSVYGNKYPKGYEKAIETISPKDIITKVDSILQKSPTLM